MFKKVLLGAAIAMVLAGSASAQFNPTAPSSPAYASLQKASNAIANKQGPATQWDYVGPTGGITTATNVTLKAAVATKRIWVTGLHLSNSGAAGTELVLNCGASGVAMWRGWIGPTSGPTTVNFQFAKPCTAGTLVEIQTISGTTIAVRVNAQGFTD